MYRKGERKKMNGFSKIYLSIRNSKQINEGIWWHYDNLSKISKKYNIWCPYKDGYCFSLDGFKFPIFYYPENEKNKNGTVFRFVRAGYYDDPLIDNNRYNVIGGVFGLTKDKEKILYMTYNLFGKKGNSPAISLAVWFDVYDDSIYPGMMHLKKEPPPNIAYLNRYGEGSNIYVDYKTYAIDIYFNGRVLLVKEPKLGKEYESL